MKSRVTILDVAAQAGVSISSVSAALNGRPGVSEDTRGRIVDVAQQLGWVPSLRGRSLSGRKAYAVGLMLERSSEVIESDPFFAGFIAGVESVLERQGFALVLQVASSRGSAVQRYRQLALDHRVDGVFLTDMSQDDARVRLVTDLGLPAVAVNSAPRCALPSVRQDHRPGLVELMEEVIALGHRRVAHVAGRRGLIHTRQRVDVWRSALAKAGLEPGPLVYGDFTIESGSRAADSLLAAGGETPTAVVCGNDLMAIGFIARVSALGIDVPLEMSVTGFDGIQLGAYVRPALTSVATAPRSLGEAAASMLLAVIHGETPSDVTVPATRLLLRDSLVDAPRT
ncbi:LacI family DNA-binding transcriptional regulator [Terrabacter sp. 2YAF2]|uniref:LacI family DNA-binding transcriptional regulator n=1 Tax=Terrabacter sp. 2YAF2 TaxID=3233026 RepID=UPI003F9804A0